MKLSGCNSVGLVNNITSFVIGMSNAALQNILNAHHKYMHIGQKKSSQVSSGQEQLTAVANTLAATRENWLTQGDC